MSVIRRLGIFLTVILIFSFFKSNDTFAHAPHDVILDIELSPTYNQDKTLFIIVRGNLLKSTDGGENWSRIVQGLDNDYSLSSLTVSSYINKILFLSSFGDGIYKSQDAGHSWFKVNNGLEELNIDQLSMPFDSADMVLAAGTKGGLYRTIDAGLSWHQVIGGNKIKAIAFSPDRENYVIIGDDKGTLFFSTDKGDTWEQFYSITDGGAITAIAISPDFSSDNTFFIGTEKRGVLRTVDRGSTFMEVNNGLSDSAITSLAITPHYKRNFTVMATSWNEAIFLSTDGGDSWEKYSKGLTTVAQAAKYGSPNFSTLKISDTWDKDNLVFLGGFDGLFRSVDGGHIWKQLDTLSPNIIIGLELSPDYQHDSTVAISTYIGGIYKTNDQGMTWSGVNNQRLGEFLSIETSFFRHYDVAFSPNYKTDKIIFSGIGNNLLKSMDSGLSWNAISLREKEQEWQGLIKTIEAAVSNWFPEQTGADDESRMVYTPYVIAVSPNFASDLTIYVGTKEGAIFRSTEGGENLYVVTNLGHPINSLVLSPDFSSDKTILAASQGKGVYKTINAGYSWYPINEGLVFREHRIELAVSPNYKLDKTVFAGTIGGIFKTQNGGESWARLTVSVYENDSNIQAIAISPNYLKDRTLLVSVKGKGLFKSIDGGENFVQIGNNLIRNNHLLSNMNNFPPTSGRIKFSPAYAIDNTIYGTSGTELFKSTDSGNTWEIVTIPKLDDD